MEKQTPQEEREKNQRERENLGVGEMTGENQM